MSNWKLRIMNRKQKFKEVLVVLSFPIWFSLIILLIPVAFINFLIFIFFYK